MKYEIATYCDQIELLQNFAGPAAEKVIACEGLKDYKVIALGRYNIDCAVCAKCIERTYNQFD